MTVRVLFTSPSGLGHVHPMVPLARAMLARGNEVLWALPADGVSHVRQAGLPVASAGPPGLPGPAEVRRRHPEFDALPDAEKPNVMFGKMFGAFAAPAILQDLVPIAHAWRPDLVVADAAEFAGHIVAAELGVPSVTKGFGAVLPERRVRSAGEEVAPLWRSRGLQPAPYGGSYDHLYLDIYPPALQQQDVGHIRRRHLLRPTAEDARMDSSSAPRLPEGSSDMPLVYVTMGTAFNDPESLKTVLAAVRQLRVRVLVTVGPHADPAVVGTQPAHVRVEAYVPQALVLPHCDLVVSHGGSGTTLATLGHGLPQLCLPQGADQFLNAEAVAAAGAGLSLLPGEATPTLIREAVARLISESSFREAAVRIAASIASMPSPEDVAELLESLA